MIDKTAFIFFVFCMSVNAFLKPYVATADEINNSVLRDILKDIISTRENTDLEKQIPARRVPLGNDEIQLSFAPLVKSAAPAVVNVYAARKVQRRSLFADDPFFDQFFGREFSGPPRIRSSLGSGVIVTSQGLVITNYHVIEGSDEVKIVLSDGREFESQIVLRDERSDLAVLQIKDNGPFSYLSFANSDELLTGDLVLAIGNPFGVGQTITSGIVSAMARTRANISDFGFFIQTDAAINPGNSGGALIDMKGNLVGINTAIFSRSGGSNGIGFAIPANMVRAVVMQAQIGNDAFERPFVGVTFESITPQIADALGLVRPVGALVNKVIKQGPAYKAGLREGDVVLRINDHVIEDSESLEYRLATIGLGNHAEFLVLSRGKEVKISIKLGRIPDTSLDRELKIIGENPFAGITISNLSPQLAQKLNLPLDRQGVVVIDVERGSLASQTGLKRGDILLSINGLTLTNVDQIISIIEQDRRSWRFVVDRYGRVLRQFLRY